MWAGQNRFDIYRKMRTDSVASYELCHPSVPEHMLHRPRQTYGGPEYVRPFLPAMAYDRGLGFTLVSSNICFYLQKVKLTVRLAILTSSRGNCSSN